MRPLPPDERITGSGTFQRDPADLEAELAKYKGISQYIEKCGELSDVTDKFHHYEARLEAATHRGLSRPYRIRMYRHYKKNSLNHLRMAANEIVRLLSQPKIIIHGNDFVRDDYQEPGFWSSVINGGKRLLGMDTGDPARAQQVQGGVQNGGRY